MHRDKLSQDTFCPQTCHLFCLFLGRIDFNFKENHVCVSFFFNSFSTSYSVTSSSSWNAIFLFLSLLHFWRIAKSRSIFLETKMIICYGCRMKYLIAYCTFSEIYRSYVKVKSLRSSLKYLKGVVTIFRFFWCGSSIVWYSCDFRFPFTNWFRFYFVCTNHKLPEVRDRFAAT